MKINTREDKALDEAILRVEYTKAWVALKLNKGGLSDEDRLRVRAELDQANDALPPPQNDRGEPGLLLFLRLALVLGLTSSVPLGIRHSDAFRPLPGVLASFVTLFILNVPLPQRWLKSRTEIQG